MLKYSTEADNRLSGDFVYDFVLDAIDEGKFSFESMPITWPPWSRSNDEWLSEQTLILAGGPRQILEHSLREFDTKFADIPESHYTAVARDVVSKEVRLSQLHPTIIEQYRRFVVLGSSEEESKGRGGTDSVRHPDQSPITHAHNFTVRVENGLHVCVQLQVIQESATPHVTESPSVSSLLALYIWRIYDTFPTSQIVAILSPTYFDKS